MLEHLERAMSLTLEFSRTGKPSIDKSFSPVDSPSFFRSCGDSGLTTTTAASNHTDETSSVASNTAAGLLAGNLADLYSDEEVPFSAMIPSRSSAKASQGEGITKIADDQNKLKIPLSQSGELLAEQDIPRALDDFVRVLVVTRRWLRKGRLTGYVSELHLEMLQIHNAVPVMVPRTPWTRAMLDGFMPMHGLLLVEGEDVGPSLDPYRGTASVDQVQKLEVQSMHPGEVTSDEDRDAIELELLQRCHRDGIPILGICRGCQLINIFRGGSLYYDIGLQVGKEVQHINYSNYDQHRHGLWVNARSPLASLFREECEKGRSCGALLSAEDVLERIQTPQPVISSRGVEARAEPELHQDASTKSEVNGLATASTGNGAASGSAERCNDDTSCSGPETGRGDVFFSLQVNSYHHQGVRQLGQGLFPIAFSEDGLVEAYCDDGMMTSESRQPGADPKDGSWQNAERDTRRPREHFVLGLQFHPERMTEDYAGCRRIFGAFVAACRRYKNAAASATSTVSRSKE
uniref:Putative glutamine amidotransferase-related n=1 Tax=Toxoplasma gondii TgCATBr9 TaxID=943120 RepID=A0A2T6IGT8_TOXGO|nr:putative glutamine amidotransferase-related [Toxoplasma gondii TgCATBr9]